MGHCVCIDERKVKSSNIVPFETLLPLPTEFENDILRKLANQTGLQDSSISSFFGPRDEKRMLIVKRNKAIKLI